MASETALISAVVPAGGTKEPKDTVSEAPSPALVRIAALSAEGKSTVLNIEQIDRGYENIEERLLNLGAQIKRID